MTRMFLPDDARSAQMASLLPSRTECRDHFMFALQPMASANVHPNEPVFHGSRLRMAADAPDGPSYPMLRRFEVVHLSPSEETDINTVRAATFTAIAKAAEAIVETGHEVPDLAVHIRDVSVANRNSDCPSFLLRDEESGDVQFRLGFQYYVTPLGELARAEAVQ